MADKRGGIYALRYTRLLAKSGAGEDIGPVAMALCCIVAAYQDVKRHKGPATFFNVVIMGMLGVSKWETLNKARDKAVSAGWLTYQDGKDRRAPGKYWACIPAGLERIPDEPFDEAPDEESYPKNGEDRGEDNTDDHIRKTDKVGGEIGGKVSDGSSPLSYPKNGEDRGEDRGEPSSYTIPTTHTRAEGVAFEIGDHGLPAKQFNLQGMPADLSIPPSGQLAEWCKIWNSTPGAKPFSRLGKTSWDALVDRLNDPNWRWGECLRKFPLKGFDSDVVPIGTFIGKKFVDGVVDANYFVVPRGAKKSGLKPGAFDPNDTADVEF